AAIARQAAGSAGALPAALDGGGHAAATIDVAGELDARGAVIVDVAVVDLDGVAVGLVALARLRHDQHAPSSVVSRLGLCSARRHAEKGRDGGCKEVCAYQHDTVHCAPLADRRQR